MLELLLTAVLLGCESHFGITGRVMLVWIGNSQLRGGVGG